VQVVFHETVRNYFNVELIGRWQKLPSDQIDAVTAGEVPAALKRAHRQENTAGTDISVVVETRRAAMRHAAGTANTDPPQTPIPRSAKAFALRILSLRSAKASRYALSLIARLKPSRYGFSR
jgi:hypothetical protein